MDESAEEIATANAGRAVSGVWVAGTGSAVGWQEPNRAVWPVLVVVMAVDAEQILGVAGRG
jgi:hypothetical protein